MSTTPPNPKQKFKVGDVVVTQWYSETSNNLTEQVWVPSVILETPTKSMPNGYRIRMSKSEPNLPRSFQRLEGKENVIVYCGINQIAHPHQYLKEALVQ